MSFSKFFLCRRRIHRVYSLLFLFLSVRPGWSLLIALFRLHPSIPSPFASVTMSLHFETRNRARFDDPPSRTRSSKSSVVSSLFSSSPPSCFGVLAFAAAPFFLFPFSLFLSLSLSLPLSRFLTLSSSFLSPLSSLPPLFPLPSPRRKRRRPRQKGPHPFEKGRPRLRKSPPPPPRPFQRPASKRTAAEAGVAKAVAARLAVKKAAAQVRLGPR